VLPDLVLFPHCDLHMAREGAPPLRLHFAERHLMPSSGKCLLVDFTGQAVIDFFAPHRPVGQRLTGLPHYDQTTGEITGGDLGVYLFQARVGNSYHIGRLQIHQRVVDWWFGNDSITTALDPEIHHAQPSIYAKFSDDGTGPNDPGTDLIGDITGHGWVTLTSEDPAAFAVNEHGRLRGIAETHDEPGHRPPQLRGELLNNVMHLDVRVVDYRKPRRELEPLLVSDIAGAAGRSNLVFLGEGFRATDEDRALFDKAAGRAAREMFDKPRHQPFPLLKESFNVFKAMLPSQQHLVTTSFGLTESPAGAGLPIPGDLRFGAAGTYTMDEMVVRVGLPKRGESRSLAELVTLWNDQGCTFEQSKVDNDLVTAWKKLQSFGILNARDTAYGLQLGKRFADKISGEGPLTPVTASDAVTDGLRNWLLHLYSFYGTAAPRTVTLDPRRHPPELLASSIELNRATFVMDYLGSLAYALPPHTQVGPEWVPSADRFTRSRGLVVIIMHEGMDGGTSFGANTLTAASLNSYTWMGYVYSNPADPGERRRNPPRDITFDLGSMVDTVVHEVGHSFNLGDEYEEGAGRSGFAAETRVDLWRDNLTGLALLLMPGVTLGEPGDGRRLDPSRVKWFDLPRITVASVLTADSRVGPDGIVVTVDPRAIGQWAGAKARQVKVSLRRFSADPADPSIAPNSRQLPLSFAAAHLVTGLDIAAVNETDGTIELTRVPLPGSPPLPVMPAGSLLFVARHDDNGSPITVADRHVIDQIRVRHEVLNQDKDTTKVNKGADHPVQIFNLNPPCKSYRLIGVYEGGLYATEAIYRPAGACKMRSNHTSGGEGEFCFVCKWLIVNRVDGSLHAALDRRFYPDPSC
jgi:hypothetical protein